MFSFLVHFLEWMNATARRSWANSKLDRASSLIKHTLEQRVLVEMDSFESPSKESKSAEKRLFKRYFPATIFFYRYLVGILYLCIGISRYQSNSAGYVLPPSPRSGRTNSPPTLDASCIVPSDGELQNVVLCLCTLVHEFVFFSLWNTSM